MIIVGADLATQSGLCFGRPDTTPRVIVTRAPITGDNYGPWGAHYWTVFNRLLDQLAEQLGPEETILINYEQPVTIEKRWDKDKQRLVGGNPITTTRKLQFLGPFLETVCELHPAPTQVFECHLSTIKKTLTGSGKADKADMVQAARRAGIELPEGSEAYDAADSFGAWVLAIQYHAPEFFDFWLRRIHGRSLGQERMSAAEARRLL